ncbi:4Fe-4S dicluster domain-containing protein [Abyssisolibacter fermentans]|uniref:4Fe-4S dicluster domain-containing protein n=1 Tax=Abyssisolibacter fermentans TaxID=1766203 RepID=UPI000829DA27|nr:4Fe-4S dicluster domain-containing protein [Abyssisolibacter fermentans]
MSKTWYPVIDYEKCIVCKACYNKCNNGVYKLDKEGRPIVENPNGCVHGCHGCGNLCPVGAILYVGDIQGKNSTNCGCSCDC